MFPVQLASSVIHLEVFLDVEHGEPVQPSAADQASQRVVFQAMRNLSFSLDFLACVLFKMLCYTGFTKCIIPTSYPCKYTARPKATALSGTVYRMANALSTWHNLKKGELCRATRHDQILHIITVFFFSVFPSGACCVANPLHSYS